MNIFILNSCHASEGWHPEESSAGYQIASFLSQSLRSWRKHTSGMTTTNWIHGILEKLEVK
jgi:hypothetical protein